MPIYTPKGIDPSVQVAAGDLARTTSAPRGFETSLPSEVALQNLGIGSESSQGVRTYEAGSIFHTEQGEYVNLTGVQVVDPINGNYTIDVSAVDLAMGNGQNLAISGASLSTQNDTSVIYFPPQNAESNAPLDVSKASDAAQQSTTATNLDPGQDKPAGGEVTQQQDASVSVDDGEGQVTYTTAPTPIPTAQEYA